MPNPVQSINLVKNKETPFIDRFIDWALTAGRLIVIFTEVVAVLAFVYRFSLDGQLAELHSSIKQKQNLVLALKPDENKYRNLQDRIGLVKTFSDKSTKTDRIIRDIINFIPSQVRINDLTLSKTKITVSINIASISELSAFIDPLKNYPEIKSVSIDNIENKPSISLLANITATLK